MRYLIFELSMPGNNSWNGKWSGENDYYAIGKKFGVKSEKPDELRGKYYHYSFGDGWAAGVKVREVNGNQYRSLIKKSVGFCRYDWMVDSILAYGEIRT